MQQAHKCPLIGYYTCNTILHAMQTREQKDFYPIASEVDESALGGNMR
jgi:hypothetical protein